MTIHNSHCFGNESVYLTKTHPWSQMMNSCLSIGTTEWAIFIKTNLNELLL